MANWIATIYDNMATAQTAINAIANTVTIHVVAIKEGAKQKVMVVKSA